MHVTIDPILGDSRKLDYKLPLVVNSGLNNNASAVINLLRGGEKYVFTNPLRALSINAVRDSPFESEIFFEGENTFVPATQLTCGLKTDWDESIQTLTLENPSAIGNARTFIATFSDDDPDVWYYADWTVRAYVDPVTRKWTIFSEYQCQVIEGEEERSGRGIFAVASTADVELEDVVWIGFNLDYFPRAQMIYEGTFVENNSQNMPPTVTLPASLGVINALPAFEGGKHYVLNIRENLLVAAEYTPESVVTP